MTCHHTLEAFYDNNGNLGHRCSECHIGIDLRYRRYDEPTDNEPADDTNRPTPLLPDPATEPMINASRVAAFTGLSVRGVLYAAERGDLPSVRVGRRVIFPTTRLLTHLGLHTPNNDGATP